MYNPTLIWPRTRQWRDADDSELEDKILSTTLPRVESALSEPVEFNCPNNCLCHNVDKRRIAELLKPLSDDSLRTDCVYVLECRQRTVTDKILREEFQHQTHRRWAHRAQENERLLYVGVSQKPANRLMQHAAGRGEGANFTQIFPAARLLSVDWYQSRYEAYRAEPITADVLEKSTDDDVMVMQPG